MPSANQPSSSVRSTGRGRQREAQIEALIDHCFNAKIIADAQDEKFLSYMLAMTIQAARGLLRIRDSA